MCGVEKNPSPDAQVSQPTDQGQERAPWPRPCWSLEAQSPIEMKEYERTG